MAHDSHPLLDGRSARAAVVRRWITTTFTGRALASGAVVKAAAWLLGLSALPPVVVGAVDTLGDLALVAGAVVLSYRLFGDLRRRLLWRVRRKLVISYIFIGVVPALLIVTFFLLGGLIVLFNIGTYMMKTRFDALVEQAHFVADSAAIGLQRAPGGTAADVLDRRLAAVAPRHRLASLVVVEAACGRSPAAGTAPIQSGPWTHAEPPAGVPQWVPCDGYAGLVTYEASNQTRAAARAVSWLPGSPTRAVIVDLPLDEALVTRLRQETGIRINGVTPSGAPSTTRSRSPAPAEDASAGLIERIPWPALVDYVVWETGAPSTLIVEIRLSLIEVYSRMSGTSTIRFGDLSFGQIMLVVLAVVGGLFLIIQSVAFFMGLGLARSITGAVHDLFEGTERVRRGEFSHKIAVRTHDQLGGLASSFNSMTASIEDLLQEKAEKERLEQELRIARSIQMSLLPQSTLVLPGIGLWAHCEPAREVGGDYYDFLSIDDRRLGVLIADVSGKGTSAALYMAELKGIVLSLSQRHLSPRQLLIDANHIVSRHLDSSSFITVSYLLIDLEARSLRYSRAGHCPMIYVPGSYAASRAPEVLAPDGMVLGLRLDDGQMFAKFLDEITLPLGPGDLCLLYTDGMSEAMNADGDCFGDARLAEVMREHADLPAETLLARILEDVTAFAGTTAQQDDMTMVLIRVEDSGRVIVSAPVPNQ